MRSNDCFALLATFGFLVVVYFDVSHAHPPTNYNKPAGVNDSGVNLISKHNHRNDHVQQVRQAQQQPQEKYPDQHPNLTYFANQTPAASRASTPTLSMKSTSTAAKPAILNKPALQSTYVYKAEVPTYIETEANKAVNKANLASSTLSSLGSTTSVDAERAHTSNATSNFNTNTETEDDDDLAKKVIGSSVVTSISVILNGDEPEFADALGQKVPKPLPSLQVASPIDLLNPDRYEFYTFDEHGELVKRLMTMEEIQSIVANGDGDGPTIIHHGPIEDRDPEKNVQDIVKNVQNVLNQEVESNKNSSTEILPVLDTPDVSSSWSMILPAIFGNTGNVDIFSNQNLQQVVMTPDTEIIETSTKELVTTTTKKPKPSKKRPGQKRRTTTTSTEMTPQIIQEELGSQESVYTGMQQYQHLAATMQNYDGLSQLNMQPLYHKLPEIETSTRRVFINNKEIVKKPVTNTENDELVLNESLAKRPASVVQKPLAPHRVKKPNGNHSVSKQPQVNKHKTRRKPATTQPTQRPSTTATSATSSLPSSTSTTPEPTTTSTTVSTTTPVFTTTTATTEASFTTDLTTAINATSTPYPIITITTAPKKRRRKPTLHPGHSIATTSGEPVGKPHLTAEKRKPAKPHRQKPKPTQQHTKYSHITSATDLAVEETAHQEISPNKFQHVSYHKTRPRPNTSIRTSTTTTTSTVPATTPVFSPAPTLTPTYSKENISELQFEIKDELLTSTTTTTNKPDSTTSLNIPSTSGTSGYPVPFTGISSNKLKGSALNQIRKPADQDENKSNEQDAHTLLSYDQIMQTLKQPEQIVESLTENIAPLKEVGNKHTLSLQDDIKLGLFSTDATFVFEGNTDLTTDNPITASPMFTSFTDALEESTTSVDEPETTNILSEKPTKHTTEYSTFNQQEESNTETEVPTTSAYNEQFTFTNNQEIDIKGNQMDTGETKYNENDASHSILVADFKHQLNMEVIKPSEQITMSDFQTQAATVASTLVDGINTSSGDEITFNVSDALQQIADNDDISKTSPLSVSNGNRYSNQAQLNLDLIMNSNTKESQNTTFFASNIVDETTDKDTTYAFTTEEAASQEFSSESVEKTTETFDTTEEEIYTKMQNVFNELMIANNSKIFNTPEQSPTTSMIQNKYDDAATESTDEYNEESVSAKLDNNYENYTSTMASEEDVTTSQTIIESNNEKEHQEIDHEREPLFEADSIVDTTTLINILPEEITTLSNEEYQSTIKTPESSHDQNFRLAENSTENEDINDSTMSGWQPESTTLMKDFINEDYLETTEISSDKIKETLALSEIGTESNTAETTQGLEDFNQVGTQTYAMEAIEEEIKSEISEDNDSTATDKDYTIAEHADPNNKLTIQPTTPKESADEDNSTFKTDKSEEAEAVTTSTSVYEMSEATSAELSAMISEEDETDEGADEDPYIKLGEVTTFKPEGSLEIETQATTKDEPIKKEPTIEDDALMSASPKPINFTIEKNSAMEIQPSVFKENDSQIYEEADKEDEEDQFTEHATKMTSPITSTISTTSITTRPTTTPKPNLTTTRRLSTLKPVSYFNKQPAYALYQEPVEPLYNKQPSLTLPKEKVPLKTATYIMLTNQHRPMQRPPQLNNLMISSTQVTRPPVKLEPSPNNSKGLEASLVNLDDDILAFVKLCNELAFSYWKSITSEKISSARSLVISPFALTSMLSMVFLGARGSTSGEMNDVLKLDDMVTFNPHLIFKNITDSVEKSPDSNIATTAFVREIYSDRANGKVLQFFKEKTQQLYAGHVEEVNFNLVNDIIRRRTNLLVKRHTMGKVLEYLRTNSVWVNGPLATISANLFQTNCSLGSTKDRDGEIFFQVHPTVRQRRLVPIPAVLFKSGFTAGYEPNLDATVVAFSRIQDTISVLYVMPGHLSSISPSDSLDRLEKQLMDTAIAKNAWSNLLTSLMDRPGMEVQIPRFSHRSFVNATLGLQKMGLKGLFKSDYADLGGLTGSSNRDIYLSDMIQINTFSTCGEEKIADHHHIEMYPAPPLRKRNKDVDVPDDAQLDSSESIIDFGSIVQDSVLGRGFYDDLLDPKYLELPLPLRPRQARVPDSPRLRLDKPFLYFARHNPTGMILFMGRFNPRLLP